jgi:hypothetical protein
MLLEGAPNSLGPDMAPLSGPILRLSIIQVNKIEVNRVFLEIFFKTKRYGLANDNVKKALRKGHNAYEAKKHLAKRIGIMSGLISNKTAAIPAGEVTIKGAIVIHFVNLITSFVSERVSLFCFDNVCLLDMVLIQDATLL